MFEAFLAAAVLDQAVPRPAQACDLTYERSLSEEIDGADGILRVHLLGDVCVEGVIYFETVIDGNTDIIDTTLSEHLIREQENTPEQAAVVIAQWADIARHDEFMPRRASDLPAGREISDQTSYCFLETWPEQNAAARASDAAILLIPALWGTQHVFWFSPEFEAYVLIGVHELGPSCEAYPEE